MGKYWYRDAIEKQLAAGAKGVRLVWRRTPLTEERVRGFDAATGIERTTIDLDDAHNHLLKTLKTESEVKAFYLEKKHSQLLDEVLKLDNISSSPSRSRSTSPDKRTSVIKPNEKDKENKSKPSGAYYRRKAEFAAAIASFDEDLKDLFMEYGEKMMMEKGSIEVGD